MTKLRHQIGPFLSRRLISELFEPDIFATGGIVCGVEPHADIFVRSEAPASLRESVSGNVKSSASRGRRHRAFTRASNARRTFGPPAAKRRSISLLISTSTRIR